jgi:cadmium resistance protein CadD (predicted permease)
MAGTGLFETLLTAALVFASTNVDDIVLLSVLFADPELPARAVVSGQFLGIGALVLVSALAGLAAVAVPPEWTALLGAVPLAIGLYKLVGLVRARAPDERPRAEHSVAGSAIGAVAGVTIANGADNLSVYIPLFAANRAAIVFYAGVFALLTGVWCWLGHRLVSNELVGTRLRRYSHIVLPIVLIGIGIHILLGARALLL